MSSPQTDSRMRRFIPLFILWLLAAASSPAAPAATGIIAGAVKDPILGEYVKGAQVSIKGSNLMTVSGTGGYYELRDVPVGEQTVEVYFSGFRTEAATVSVSEGATVTKDFSLSPTTSGPGEGEVVTLSAFVVSTERAGNAKALMDQRNSMNVVNSVDSQTFGDNAEGNIGEFMRYMPGVQVAAGATYGEVRQLRIRGFTAEYSKVTMDGMTVASSDASSASRGFSLETATLNSMDSIELSKTLSADMDADAPAGTINLKTKKAFDRTGRQINVQANMAMHSEEMTFRKTPGPYDHGLTNKYRLGGILEYSDVFFNKRLGIVLNLSESNVYQEAIDTNIVWNRTTSATDQRPLVINTLSIQHAPRFNHRSAATMTVDFKATPALSFGITYVYNYADLYSPQRTVTFRANRAGIPDSPSNYPLTSYTTAGTGSGVTSSPVQVSKQSDSTTIIPRFEYRKGAFLLEGKASYSMATSEYHPLTHKGVVKDFAANAPTVYNAQYTAQRTKSYSGDWNITQASGPDFSNGANYVSNTASNRNYPIVTVDDGRASSTKQLQLLLDATYRTRKLLPVAWKTGAKYTSDRRRYNDTQTLNKYTYVGPSFNGTLSGFPGAYAGYESPYRYDLGLSDGGVLSSSGNSVFVPDGQKFAQVYQEHPEYFRQGDITSETQRVTDYFEGMINRKKNYEEKVYASYVMATAQFARRTTVRGGVRFEQTDTDSEEPNPFSQSEVLAAFPGTTFTNGRAANSIDALNYQYLSRPYIHRTGKYHNYFPSGSVKFVLSRNLELLNGYAGTIRRPGYNNVAGIVLYDDATRLLQVPNITLKPETSKNFSSRLAYYFEPSGTLSVSVFQNSVKNAISQNTLPITDPQVVQWRELYPNATDVRTYVNTDQRVKVRGMEIEYVQALRFLPGPLKGLSLRGSYTRTYAEILMTGLAPHIVTGSVSYTLGRFSTNINMDWTDNYPQTSTGATYRRHRTEVGAGASWKISKGLSVSLNVKNIFNTPMIEMQHVPPAPDVSSRNVVWGTSYTLAVKGSF